MADVGLAENGGRGGCKTIPDGRVVRALSGRLAERLFELLQEVSVGCAAV